MLNGEIKAILDAAGVEYQVKMHERPALTSETAAAERGVRVSQIVKCMVGEIPSGPLVAMLIPGDRILKIRKARHILGGRRVELMEPESIASKLGFTVGAISPLQLLGNAELLLDRTVLDEKLVDISAGDPLMGIELKSSDLLSITGATVCDIISSN